MADPFSIIAGTAGLADVCVRLIKFIRHANEGIRTVDQDLQDLVEEIVSLHSINNLIEQSFAEGLAVKADPYRKLLQTHWEATQNTLNSCGRIVERIATLLQEVFAAGSGKNNKLYQLRKWLRQQSKQEEFNVLRQKLQTHQMALQLSLESINLIYARSSQKNSEHSHAKLDDSLQSLNSKIKSVEEAIRLSAEDNLKSAVTSAQNVAHLANLNKHFYAPQSVRSIFVGRKNELYELKKHLLPSSREGCAETQKRFIVFGLSGSGKTQFCCKFASDNRQSFWGVFWIDASSQEHAEQSFSMISTIGKVAPNKAAVKSWLSSLGPEQPWLLIIDNADQRDFPVDEYFPDSSVGTVLITTRNPILKTHGTVGPRYFEFQGLDEKTSVDLLLRTANESMPWIPSSVTLARTIADAMGYLPIALIHAGTTILARLCTLETYLEFFEKGWARIRKLKEPNTTSTISDTNAAIYSSYELILKIISDKETQSSDDALDLLKVIAFLDRQRITPEIFIRAALNPGVEQLDKMEKETQRKTFNTSKPQPTLSESLRDLLIRIVGLLSHLGHRPVLPKFLSETCSSGDFQDLRLREAFNELFQMSLISTSSEKEDSYSMHAAVHLWARQRPEMKLAEQAVWCQVTATILAQAVLPPPLGETEKDENFHRSLLPHVRHVQQAEQRIQMLFAKNRESSRRLLPIFQPSISSEQLLQLVKFSLVYGQAGCYEDAETLQSYVASIATRYLGMEHMSTINITRLLSRTYWQLARINEAAELQKRALDACIKVLGRDNPETLQIMDSYGSCLWLQGRIPESRKVHTTAVEGLTRILGRDDIQTLKAMGGLGRAVGKDFDFTEAINIQSRAFEGLKAKLGPSQSATLEAMDNLAMAHFDRAAFRQGQPGDLARALQLESEVFSRRVETLGREHYHTLWSGLNLARIKAICGETDEALAIFLPGHNVVRRDLGPTHFIYLFGEMHHGRILMCAGRYTEAETILSNVISSHKDTRNHHPNRLLALFSLIKCRNVLERDVSQTATMIEELMGLVKKLYGPDHAAVEYLLDGRTLSKSASDVLDKWTSL